MKLYLKNKLAVVTGNSKGIGKAITEFLRSEGVTVPDISRSSGYDLETKEGLLKLFNEVTMCDILINNVGGGGRWGDEDPLLTKEEVWGEVYYKNADVARKCTMHFLPYMIKQGWGRVITIASIYGHEGGGRPFFNMAKSAEIALMKSLSLMSEYVEKRITFNSVSPGYVDVSGKKITEEHASHSPIGRPLLAEEVSSVVTFLCSDIASGINGENIRVDGGLTRGF